MTSTGEDPTDHTLVRAIEQNRLGAVAGRTDGRAAAAAFETCRRIARDMKVESDRITSLLLADGIDAAATVPETLQRHEIVFRTTLDSARRAVEVLEHDAYRRHHRWAGGADASFWRTANRVTLTSTAAVTTVVRLEWGKRDTSTAVRRLTTPRPPDWDAVRLPGPLWWAYSAVRPVRLAAAAVGLARRNHVTLEPYLATPHSLIEPLLRLADVTSDDTVADIGCGDGRLVVEAARLTGCRAVGVEAEPDLVRTARRAVTEAGLDDRVRIVDGDGRLYDVGDVTAVLLFLPGRLVGGLVADLLGRLRPGARIIAHEQSPLPDRAPAPHITAPLISADAVTVGRIWLVGARPGTVCEQFAERDGPP